MKIWNIGYPRIGQNREIALAVQQFEQKGLESQPLLDLGKKALRERWSRQHELGVDSIPINDFSFWDPLLDTAWLFNLIPKDTETGEGWLAAQLQLAQSKLPHQRWFNTTYRGFAPVWDTKTPLQIRSDKLDWEMSCYKGLPYPVHVTLIGPWTLAKMCRTGSLVKTELLEELAIQYGKVLKDIKKKGIEWVQLEEPSLGSDLEKRDIDLIEKTYQVLAKGAPKLLVSVYYESPDPWLTNLTALPVQGFHFDVVSGPATLSWIKTRAFPKDKLLCLGLVNARNVWASGLASLYKQLEILKGFHSESKMALAPSASLFHLPLTIDSEPQLEASGMASCLAFADERLAELAKLKKALIGDLKLSDLEKEEVKVKTLLVSVNSKNEALRGQLNRLEINTRKRHSSCVKRNKIQAKKLNLPKIPISLTTMPVAEESILFQEQHHCDVLLPDSFDSYQKLNDTASVWSGFRVTQNGWVQLRGSLCYKPPIVVSDIEWKSSDTQRNFQNAQTKTTRMVKGVAVGPLSLLNGSFVRQDLPFEQTLLQAAFAVRRELLALEEAGACIIQVDEPFFCEAFPAKNFKRAVVSKNLVDICRLATSPVKDETQVHLNLIGVQLDAIQEALSKIDVDVLCFRETELDWNVLANLKKAGVEAGIGTSLLNGYHKVKSEKEFELLIRKVFERIAPERLWITPEVKTAEELNYVVQATLFIRRLLQGMK